MNWLFWTLLIVGIILVIWPFFTALSTGAAVFLWILGALFIIAAFFMLPAWWARPAMTTAGPGGYTGEETAGPGAIYPGPAPYHTAETPSEEEPPSPEDRRDI